MQVLSSGSQERKLQRRSVRSRSESDRGTDPVPKKKTKKEQVPVIPIRTTFWLIVSVNVALTQNLQPLHHDHLILVYLLTG